GALVEVGHGPGVLGAEHPAPVRKDRAEDLPGFAEPVPALVGDCPGELVACQDGQGIVRVPDADAVIEGLPVAFFGRAPVLAAGSDPGEFVAAVEDVFVLGPQYSQPDPEDIPE